MRKQKLGRTRSGLVAGALSATALAGCGGDGTGVEDPLPDLVIASVMLSQSQLVDDETVDIVVEVANRGEGATPSTVPVRLSLGGTTLETVQAGRLESEGIATVEFTAGPFEAGTHSLEITADPDGQIEETQEDNNSTSRAVRVVGQPVIGLDSPVTVSSNTVNEVLLFRVEITDPSEEALNVELSGGSGDADLFVHFGERPGHQYEYRCASGNAASDELCQLVPTREGTYHIAVHAYTAFGPSTLEVTVGGTEVEPYDVELVFLERGTSSQDAIMVQAAERWEEVIGMGAVDFDYSTNPQPAGSCGPGSPGISDVVDDIRIYVTIDSIDGAGGSEGNIVGQAAPCSWRLSVFQAPGTQQRDTIHKQVITGLITLDEYDVDQMESRGVLLTVVTHEMAHVLGFGTLWDVHARLRNPSVPDRPSGDTHFEGPLTIAAFDGAGGGAYAQAKVPVENSGIAGSADGHWRQSVFENELMNPFLVPGAHPMSVITLESLYEIGYEINLREAESFSLSQGGGAGMARPRDVVVDLRNDIAPVPMMGMDQKTGRVVTVVQPRRR